MFDLEQAIAEWRREMAAAGVNAAALLDELESHLREDIERQTRSGSHPQASFEIAIQRIGQVSALGPELLKASRAVRPDKWERLLVLLVSFCCVIPLGLYGLFQHEMGLGWRLAGFADIGVTVWSVFCWRWINQCFPIIPDRRVRLAIGLSCGFIGMAGMVVLMNFVLPHFELTEGQLTVVVLWGLTLMAAFGVVVAGLEEAVKIKGMPAK